VSAGRRQAPEGGWGELTVDELKTELEARGLTKSGKKDELIARLEKDDAVPAAAPIEEATAEAAQEAPEAVETPEADSEEAQQASEDAAAAADADEEAAEDAGAEDADAGEAAEAEGAEEAAAHEAEAEEEPEAEPRRRRGSAETSTGAQRRARAPRPEEGLVVRARAKYVRSAPRKARLVMHHIRGKRVEDAQAILAYAPRAVSGDILKLLNSAVANAESAYELGADELTVRRAYVDEGPTIKRYRPRALGRATRIAKRTSHMTIELTTEGNGR
jgi:ribosomal protein L22